MTKMRLAFLSLLPLIMCVICNASAHAQQSYPMIMSLDPVAIQVGTTTDHVVKSRYDLWGTTDVFISGEGVTAEVIHPELKEGEDPPSITSLTIRVTASASAQPGVRDFRLATPRGVSTVGQVVIVRDKVVHESQANDTRETAQPFELPSVICGAIEKAEDVDYFKFNAMAGTKVTFHVRCMRLQNRIHDLQTHADPMITIRNATGSTIAANDNYFAGDSYLVHTFQQTGEFYLEIRDVRYKSNAYWEYSVEVVDRDFVTNVFPLALPVNRATTVELIGSDLAENIINLDPKYTRVKPGSQSVSIPMGAQLSNPVSVYGTHLPITFESAADNNSVESAQEVAVNTVHNGCLEEEADVDYFAFQASKGDKLTIDVIARRCGSMADTYLRIVNAEGTQLNSSDDFTRGKRNYFDSKIENWTVPADGTYYIQLHDRHLRGGAEYVYAIRLSYDAPTFELSLDTDKTQTTPGTGGVVFCRVTRKSGFAGEIQLHVDGVPEGVTATPSRILASGNDGCVVFKASPDAAKGIHNVRIYGTAELEFPNGDKQLLTVEAAPYQETYMPGGGRSHFPVDVHTVSIADPSDLLAVTVSTNEVTINPGGEAEIDVEVTRKEGFATNVSLDVIFQHLNTVYGNSLPKGVKMDGNKSKILLTGDLAKGKITLVADDSAESVDRQLFCVMANVSLNFVMKATYASDPIFITVAPKNDTADGTK